MATFVLVRGRASVVEEVHQRWPVAGPARERNRVLYSSMYPADRSSERMHRKTLLPRHHCQEF
jgi:hypothetical protein